MDCIVATPADLQKIGLVDYIISEDSDLLVFGNLQYTKVIYKVNVDNDEGELLELNKILTNKKFEAFTHKMFQMMCILSGCDYLPSVEKNRYAQGVSTGQRAQISGQN